MSRDAATRELSPKPAGFWREASESELLGELQAVGVALTLEQAQLVLLNAYISPAVMERLLELEGLRSHYRWRCDLARARLTPLTAAMSLVAGLYWRELAQLAKDVRLRPQLRRQSEQLLIQRLGRLALGEKIALARIATAPLVAELRKDSHPRVMAALLENPRLAESDLLPLLIGDGGTPSTLTVIAKSRRWANRRPIRLALARNHRTPLALALNILPSISKSDLGELCRDPRVPPAIRKRCEVLLGRQPSEGGPAANARGFLS